MRLLPLILTLGLAACSDVQILKNDTAGETAQPESRGLTCEQVGLDYTGTGATGCGSPEAGPWNFWISVLCVLPEWQVEQKWEGGQAHYSGTAPEKASSEIQPIPQDESCPLQDILVDDQTILIAWPEAVIWYAFHKPADPKGGGVFWMGSDGALWVVVPEVDKK